MTLLPHVRMYVYLPVHVLPLVFVCACRGQVLLTIIQPDSVVSAIHSFVKDRKEARLLDQVCTYVCMLRSPVLPPHEGGIKMYQ